MKKLTFSIFTLSLLGTGTILAHEHDETLEDFQKEFAEIDEERGALTLEMSEREALIEQYLDELQSISDDRAAVTDTVAGLKNELATLKSSIRQGERELRTYERQFMNQAERQSHNQLRRDELVSILKSKFNTVYQGLQTTDETYVLGSNATINDVLIQYNSLSSIAEQDLERIEELNVLVTEEERTREQLEQEQAEVEARTNDIAKQYEQHVALELKLRILENELASEHHEIAVSVDDELFEIDRLRQELQDVATKEQEINSRYQFHESNLTGDDYTNYLNSVTQVKDELKDSIEANKEAIAGLEAREEKSNEIISTYRATMFELEQFAPELFLEREHNIEAQFETVNSIVDELETVRAYYDELLRESSDSKEEIEAARVTIQELEGRYQEAVTSYHTLVLDRSILDQLKAEYDVSAFVDVLDTLETQYNNVRLQPSDYATLHTLRQVVERYTSQLNLYNGSGFIRPTYGRLSYGFGPRKLFAWESFHYGLDIANSTGTPIFAVMDGRVVNASWNNGGYGNLIVVEHQTPDGSILTTAYAHLSAYGVKVGDVVRQGDTIGLMGSTGNSTGPHLHFEVLVGKWGNGNKLDPAPYFKDMYFTRDNLHNR